MLRSIILATSVSVLFAGTATADHGKYYVSPGYGAASYDTGCIQTRAKKTTGEGAVVGAIVGGLIGGAIGNNVDSHPRSSHRYRRAYGHGYGNGYGHRSQRGRHHRRNDSNSGEVFAGAVLGALIGGSIGNAVERNNANQARSNCSNWIYDDVPPPTRTPSQPIAYEQSHNGAPGAQCKIVSETARRGNKLVTTPVEVCRDRTGRWVRQ